MRLFIPALLLACSLFAQEKKFTINTFVKGCPDGTRLYLSHKYNDATLVDSAFVKKERAAFKGVTPEPNMYWLSYKKTGNPDLIFFVDGGKIDIMGHVDSLGKSVVKAGETQNEYKASLDITSKYTAAKALLLKKFQAYNYRGDQEGAKRIIDSAQQCEKEYVNAMLDFIKKNPGSNVGGYMIFSATFDWPSIPDYDLLYNALGENVKNGKFGKLALNKITSIKGTTIGYPALDFTQTDVNGKNVSLSSYKGKVVLVDFWASWCGPCRRENPNVVAAYNKYKDKGFDVFGVSLDENKDKWLQAIQKDGLAWTHVSDLKGWQNEASKAYGVTSIPFNLLLDKDGKILAKGLRGADLDATLAKIFGE